MFQRNYVGQGNVWNESNFAANLDSDSSLEIEEEVDERSDEFGGFGLADEAQEGSRGFDELGEFLRLAFLLVQLAELEYPLLLGADVLLVVLVYADARIRDDLVQQGNALVSISHRDSLSSLEQHRAGHNKKKKNTKNWQQKKAPEKLDVLFFNFYLINLLLLNMIYLLLFYFVQLNAERRMK